MTTTKDTFTNLKKKMEAARTRPLGFRMLKPRTRWHVLVRRVILNKTWLSQLDTEKEAGELYARKKKTAVGELSQADKALLRRPVGERSDDEKDALSVLFRNLRHFRQYPEHVRTQLAMFMHLGEFDAGRVISKQGHYPQAMYFVSSGYLEMWQSEYDPVLGEEKEMVGVLGPGDAFGGMNLLQNSRLTRTILTKTFVELLVLSKHDFETVLRATVMNEWTLIRGAIAEFPYFDKWKDLEIQDISIQSKIVHYADGETILGDGAGQPNMSYFVLSGKVMIVQHLVLVRKDHKPLRVVDGSVWGPNVKCMPLGTPIDHAQGEVIFVEVAVLDKGGCFSLGESRVDRRIVAKGDCRMMLVPTFSLMSRDDSYLWIRIRDMLERRLPPQRELFLSLLNYRDWMAYRHELVRGLPKHPGNHTTIHDVPLFYRVGNTFPSMRYSAFTLERSEDPRKWQWIVKRKEKAIQDSKIAAAKLEFCFDKEYLQKHGEKQKAKKKRKTSEVNLVTKDLL